MSIVSLSKTAKIVDLEKHLIEKKKKKNENICRKQARDALDPKWQSGHEAGKATGAMIVFLEIMNAVRVAGREPEKLKEATEGSLFPSGYLEVIGQMVVEGLKTSKVN